MTSRLARIVRYGSGAVTSLLAVMVVAGVGLLAVSWMAGWRLRSIDSASMHPAVPRDSLVAVEAVAPERIGIGDVIAYDDPGEPGRGVLHRVVGVRASATGGLYFETKGDGNDGPDPLLVAASAVDGRMQWHTPVLGGVARLLRPPIGIVVLCGPPLVYVLASARRSPWPSRTASSGRRAEAPTTA